MKKKILVVDDEAAIVELLQLVLQDEGYEVQTSLDGAGLRQLSATWQPDLILLDILLAGEDGRVLCRSLKSQEQTRHIPVILCSASVAVQPVAADCGANAFLRKPFHLVDLCALVARTLSPDQAT